MSMGCLPTFLPELTFPRQSVFKSPTPFKAVTLVGENSVTFPVCLLTFFLALRLATQEKFSRTPGYTLFTWPRPVA